MFEVPKTMLTLDKRGLLFAGAHVLAPLCGETGKLDIAAHRAAILARLAVAYRQPQEDRVVLCLEAAAKAWNRGDAGRAAFGLMHARLPDPKDDGDFYFRLALAGKALAAGRTPDDVLKTFGGSIAWMNEPRIPAGHGRGSGDWTDGDDDGAGVIDVAARQGHPVARWNAKVKALPKSSLDALRTAMRLENLPENQFADMAWIMAQESEGIVGVANSRGGNARGLFQLEPVNHHFYPSGEKSIGNAVEEAQGGIRYMRDRYVNAAKAKAAWIRSYEKNPKNPYW
jgi:hypothetical protein